MPSLIQVAAICILLLWAAIGVSYWNSGRLPYYKKPIHIVESVVVGLYFTIIITACCAVAVLLGYLAAGYWA